MITSKQAKKARLTLGVSQNKIAKDTGLSRPYLSDFELGKYNPNDEFKETLKAYYTKECIVFEDQAAKPTKENQSNEQPTMPKPDTKLARGILVDINTISLNEANAYADEVDFLMGDLLELQEKKLPTKKGNILAFFNNVIDKDLLVEKVEKTMYEMAKAYRKILTIQG